MESKKQVLMDFGDVRIIRFDVHNVAVQKRIIGKDGEPGWDLFGYYLTTRMALSQIFEHDLLLPDQKMELAEYLYFQKQAFSRLEEETDGMLEENEM